MVLDVDTGTDDAGALWCASTHPRLDLVAALAGWGNTSAGQAVANTLAVLAAAGAPAPVHRGFDGPSGDAPTTHGAEIVMRNDGLGDVGVVPPPDACPDSEPAAHALVRLARAHPTELTLVALAPLTTVAAALELEPALPSLLRSIVVMGGAIRSSGNITAAAEANIGHDPEAAANVFAGFGADVGSANDTTPKLVPLDVTLPAALALAELAAVERSPLPGAGTLHRIWSAIWPSGVIELGPNGEGRWPCHDLVALWALIDPDCFDWVTGPLHVDTGGSHAWGATILDRRGTFSHGHLWSVALRVDVERLLAGVRGWLGATVQ